MAYWLRDMSHEVETAATIAEARLLFNEVLRSCDYRSPAETEDGFELISYTSKNRPDSSVWLSQFTRHRTAIQTVRRGLLIANKPIIDDELT